MRAAGNAPSAAPSGQLALGVGLATAARLDNFVPGANGAVVATLSRLLVGEFTGHVYLQGAQGTGKTHLLQACCAAVQARGKMVAYLPLAARDGLSKEVLTGLERASLVCIDDVDGAAGDAAWESWLFNFYNEADAAGSHLLFSGRRGPGDFRLPDLRSRLSATLLLGLRSPDDALRREVLARRARELGITLAPETLDFILARQPRDLGSLTALVHALDRYALAVKRRVTTSLVREYLETRTADF